MAGVRLDATLYSFAGRVEPIYNPFPAWLLSQLPTEQIALGYLPDWWAVFCIPLEVTIPGFILRPPAACPPGTALGANGLCTVLDPPIPRGLRNLAGISRTQDRTLDRACRGSHWHMN
jgi:hypothetical protein